MASRANAGTLHRVGMDRPMMSIAGREMHAPSMRHVAARAGLE